MLLNLCQIFRNPLQSILALFQGSTGLASEVSQQFSISVQFHSLLFDVKQLVFEFSYFSSKMKCQDVSTAFYFFGGQLEPVLVLLKGHLDASVGFTGFLSLKFVRNLLCACTATWVKGTPNTAIPLGSSQYHLGTLSNSA